MDLNSLYKFFTRQTSNNEVAQIRAWAEASTGNMDRLMEQRRMFDAMLLLGEDCKAKKSVRKNKFYQYLGHAAVIAAVAFISAFAAWHFQPEAAPEMLAMKVPAGQRLELKLADGTTVHINGGTTFSYPTVFGKDERRVEMEGQCFFDVAKNPARPFTIATSLGNVRVLGTTLNVDVSTKDDYFTTSLLDGEANVESQGQTYALSPGQMVTITSAGCSGVSPIPEGEDYLWTKGIISFHDQKFPSIMKKFEKYFGINIRIDRPEDFTQSYSGKFYITDGVEYALKVLQYDTKFTYDWDHASQTITIK